MSRVSVLVPYMLWVVLILSSVGLNPRWTEAASQVCVQDDVPSQVCVTPFPQRVISLAPSLTETLFDLGAGQALVGRSARCNDPKEALAVSIVGAYMSPDLERIMSLRPDLVVSPEKGMREDFAGRLTGLGIPVFVDNSNSLDDIIRMVQRLGKLLGKQAQADAVVKRIQERRKAVAERVSHSRKPLVLFAVGTRPLVVAGGKTFMGSLIREAGGVNVAEKSRVLYPRLSMEEVIRHDPDFIIVLNKDCTGHDCVDQWQVHQDLKAVRERHIYQVDADLMARPCPRIIKALEQLTDILHQAASEKTLSTGMTEVK